MMIISAFLISTPLVLVKSCGYLQRELLLLSHSKYVAGDQYIPNPFLSPLHPDDTNFPVPHKHSAYFARLLLL